MLDSSSLKNDINRKLLIHQQTININDKLSKKDCEKDRLMLPLSVPHCTSIHADIFSNMCKNIFDEEAVVSNPWVPERLLNNSGGMSGIYPIWNILEKRKELRCPVYEKGRELFDMINYSSSNKDLFLFLIEMAKGIQQIGNCGYVHRDIKPDNFVMLEDGRVQLLDFDGLVLDGTTPTVARGTLDYIAPEGWMAVEITKAADVYSLGAWMYYQYNPATFIEISKKFKNNYTSIAKNKYTSATTRCDEFITRIGTLKVYGLNDEYQEVARKLILRMVDVNPVERPKIEEVIENMENWKEYVYET
eukprot:GHVR01082722.1.p1 GENE.GHVR01082722.1~~GHVR01082722.1.p1  ORF type:complete len:304 (+),score=41.47 GHVR01082722.1:267-1178(+)